MKPANYPAQAGNTGQPPLEPLRDLREIYTGERYSLWRGVRVSDALSLVLKMPRRERHDVATSARLTHEFGLIRALNQTGTAAGVVQAYSLCEHEGRLCLVVEDAGLVDLAAALRNRTLEVEDFLDWALQMAAILGGVHRNHVIHRDLSLANFVVGDGGKITLIDFNLATTAVSQVAPLTITGALAGTLSSISPEQTGLLKKVVDHRADLYSLGAVFYEMLAGVPPFVGSDPLEVVHAHLARVPASPSVLRPDLPRVLSEIVLKLLSKPPEQRYQSAESLHADLLDVQANFKSGQAIPEMELARLDKRELVFPEKMVGCDSEIEELEAALGRVQAGNSEFVLVAGLAGSGKTSVIDALRDHIVKSSSEGSTVVSGGASGNAAVKTRFSEGKCDFLRVAVPFVPLIETLSGLVRSLLSETEDVKKNWRAEILQKLGSNVGVITDLVPEFEGLVGQHAAAPQLGPAETENRLFRVVSELLQVFTSANETLVLFFDDLQWSDQATLKFISYLAMDSENRHILLLGAYRSEEVDEKHVLKTFPDQLSARLIELGPLTQKSVAEFLGQCLRNSPKQVKDLSEIIFQRTGGSPLFLKKFLRHLSESGVLQFDLSADCWRCDIHKMKQIPAAQNVVDLLVASIQRCPVVLQESLQWASCIGHRFDLGLLAALRERSVDDAAQTLWDAVQAEFLIPAGSAGDGQVVYVFSHDRVQEAAYSLQRSDLRGQRHSAIGHRLLSDLLKVELEERIMEVTDQLNLAQGFGICADAVELSTLNFRSGLRSKSASAHQAALGYFKKARALFSGEVSRTEHALWFDTCKNIVECEYFAGSRKAADELVDELLKQAETRVEKAEIYHLKLEALTIRAENSAAIDWGIDALRQLGYDPPPRLSEWTQANEVAQASLKAELAGRGAQDLLKLPRMTDSEKIAAMQLLSDLCPTVYWSRPDIYEWVGCTMTRLSSEYGSCVYSFLGYIAYGIVVSRSGRPGCYPEAYEYGWLSLEVAKQMDNPYYLGRAFLAFSTSLANWGAPMSASPQLFRHAEVLALRSGDLLFAGIDRFCCVRARYDLGTELSRLAPEIDQGLAFMERISSRAQITQMLPYRQAVRCLMGYTHGSSLEDKSGVTSGVTGFTEEAFLKGAVENQTAVAFYWTLRLQTAFLLGDFEVAIHCARRAEQVRLYMSSLMAETELYVYRALTCAQLWPQTMTEVGPGSRSEMGQIIHDATEVLRARAEACPQNFRHKYLLVAAEQARIQEKSLEAEHLYDQALSSARQEGFTQDEALICELYGRFHTSLGHRETAEMLLSIAVQGYLNWGATAKVRLLVQEFPDLSFKKTVSESVTSVEAQPPSMDLMSVIRASEALAGEVDLDRLLEKLVSTSLASAGAERVAVVLQGERKDEGQGERGATEVRAEARAESGVSGVPYLLKGAHDLPVGLIERGLSRGESMILGDAVNEGDWVLDPYIHGRSIRSVMLIPLTRQGRTLGALYFENNLAPDIFTPARLQLFEILSGQIATAIENSQLVQKISRQSDERKRAVELRDDFISLASHELKTPLVPLKLTVEMLQKQLLSEANSQDPRILSFRKMIHSSLEQLDRLTHLIDDMLNVTRIPGGRLALRLEKADLSSLVKGVLERFRIQMERSGCSVKLTAESEVRGNWDVLRVEQIFTNLLTNAMKYGGKAPVEISVSQKGEMAFLSVRDHGVGILEKDLARIFERFERATTFKNFPGLGLGLYISQEFAKAHGGRVSVSSEPGRGSTFTLELPLHPANSLSLAA